VKGLGQARQRIRYVQIETSTACNYKCVYCPVAYIPRRGGLMPISLVRKLADQLSEFSNLELMYLNGYDEPTLNPYLVECMRILGPVGVKIILLTNGTRLDAELAERILETGARVEFDIHLSATEPEDFRRIHGSPLFRSVMRNLNEIASSKVAGNVALHIGMQVAQDAAGDLAFARMVDLFAGTPFQVARYVPNDRAGLVPSAQSVAIVKKLGGCSLEGRTDRWLHIAASGNVLLCCQDYLESYVVGDAARSTLDDILHSPERKRFHSWTSGEEEAPDDYICRRCAHAIAAG
jgi:radical SAM protein with 4Fe4S-binding SPASM domain